MSMDIRDYNKPNIQYEKTINVYQNDNVDNIINQFIIENDLLYETDELFCRIKKIITNINNAFEILEDQYITCIGAKICYYDYDKKLTYDIERASYGDKIKPKWYLFNVWRTNRNCHNNC